MTFIEGLITFLNLLGFKYNKTEIDESENVNITISGDNNQVTNNVSIDKSKQVNISLNIDEALKSHPEETKKFIRDFIRNEEVGKILEISTDSQVEEIKRYESKPGHLDIVNQLKDVLPKSELDIIRAALIIRAHYLEGNKSDIGRLKEDIGQRWGQRGRDIANLCSTMYFENLIIPVLKEEMTMPFPHTDFISFYNSVVDETAYSVFVPIYMQDDELIDKIIIQSNRNVERFNLNYVNIHAIGKDNVIRVKKIISELYKSETFYDFNELININKSETTIYAKLIFTEK